MVNCIQARCGFVTHTVTILLVLLTEGDSSPESGIQK